MKTKLRALLPGSILLLMLSVTQASIVLPNSEALGKSAILTNQLLVVPTASGTNTFPGEVRFVVKNGVIDEIQVFYGEKVDLEDIAAALGKLYKEFEMPGQTTKNSRMWRVLPSRFVIQLSKHRNDRLLTSHENDCLLIFARMKP